MHTLDINDEIRIPLTDIRMVAVRSQGAGGQNVNKVATAIHLSFDSQRCEALPPHVRIQLLSLRDHRVTDNGLIVIKSQAHRSQSQNRTAALNRLAEIVQRALRVPKIRIPTKPSRASNKKRLDAKNRRGDLKRSRRYRPDD